MVEIRYTLQDGSLPIGISLDEETGDLTGDIDFANVGLGPQWISPDAGSLGSFDEGEAVSLALVTELDNGQPANLGIIHNGKDYLPWGLKLDPTTGVISGTIADLFPSQQTVAVNRNNPIWQTQFGKLADYEVGQSASLTVLATARANKTMQSYHIVQDGLPWGLRLNSVTGAITGTVAELKNPGLTIETPKLPVPAWNTPTGNIGTVNELTSVSIQIGATPAAGRTMSKYIIRRGGLPWGLRLDPVTGQITGTVADVMTQVEPLFYDNANNPVISTNVVINGTPTEVTSLLGSLSKGQAFTAQFSATPISGRTISRWALKSGTLPFGLRLSSSGLISGTVSMANHVGHGTYTFTVEAFDNVANWNSRTFTLTIQ